MQVLYKATAFCEMLQYCHGRVFLRSPDRHHFAGSNSDLMKILSEEAELAKQRTDKHWDAVLEKQKRCKKLEQQLRKLRYELEGLQPVETNAYDAFSAALQLLQSRKQQVENEYRTVQSQVRCGAADAKEEAGARYAMQSAQNKWRAMHKEQLSASGALTSEGGALQDARHAVERKQAKISNAEKDLENERKPPYPLYQPLPDSRNSDYEALAVLFYTRSDLTGSMPRLQQFCCAAQLAVCAWPLKKESLWDISKAVSASDLEFKTWNDYLRTKHCPYIPRSSTVASVDTSNSVHAFANFQVPDIHSAEVCFMCKSLHAFNRSFHTFL